MPEVHTSQHFDVGAEELWGRIGDYATLADWHPGIASQTAVEGGHIRELHLEGGGVVVEALVDQTPTSYTYRIQTSPLPVRDYVATLAIEPAGEGASDVTWTAEFVADGATDEEAEAVILGIFRGGLEAL